MLLIAEFVQFVKFVVAYSWYNDLCLSSLMRRYLRR